MPTFRFSLILGVAALVAWPTIAAAQVVSRAPRGFRGVFADRTPPDPNRPRQDLVFTLSAVGGIDDNAGAGESVGPPIVSNNSERGSTSQVDLGLDYRRGTPQRSFALSSWGSFQSYYSGTNLPNSRNGGFGVSGRTEASRRTSIGGGARFGYQSQLPLSGPLAIGEPDPVPTPAGLTGLLDRGNWLATLEANGERRWSRRTTTRVAYTFATTEFIDGRDGDLRSHQLQTMFTRQLGRTSSFDAAYELGETRVGIGANDPGRPRTDHRIHSGFTYSRRLSATRTVDLSAHGGALYVDATSGSTLASYTVWTPFAQASARVGVWRQWSLDTAYQRSTQSIPGFTRPETYITDTVSTAFGGLVGSRADVVVSGSFATGTTGTAVAGNSEYLTSGAAAQVRISITRSLAAVVGYHYYRYRFTETELPIGLPPEFDRSAVRVGLSLSLPVIGGYTDRAR